MNSNLLLTNANVFHLPIRTGSVHQILTSTPYWNQRVYATAQWEGGVEVKGVACRHEMAKLPSRYDYPMTPGSKHAGDTGKVGTDNAKWMKICPGCGAKRIDKQLGQEDIPDCFNWAKGLEPCGECFVCRIRLAAREFWRVLRDEGTFWFNIDDTFAGSGGAGGDYNIGGGREGQPRFKGSGKVKGWKQKDLVGVSWLCALALQRDGWWLRNAIPWVKPNAYPESAKDRLSASHEYWFLFSKSQKYYFDMDAIRVPYADPVSRTENQEEGGEYLNPDGRHHRTSDVFLDSLWEMMVNGNRMVTDNKKILGAMFNTESYAGAHFATFPPDLILPMLKAGTSEYGVCATCGTPWTRVVKNKKDYQGRAYKSGKPIKEILGNGKWVTRETGKLGPTPHVTTLGWKKGCACEGEEVIPAVVFDPFCGSGTTGLVARGLGRRFVGCDLSLKYLQNEARERLGIKAVDHWVAGQAKKAELKARVKKEKETRADEKLKDQMQMFDEA